MPSDRFLVVAAKKAHLAALLLPLLVLWCCGAVVLWCCGAVVRVAGCGLRVAGCGLRVAGVVRRCWAEFLCGLGQMSLWMGRFLCVGQGSPCTMFVVCDGAAGLSIYRSARMMAGMAKAALPVAAPVYWHT